MTLDARNRDADAWVGRPRSDADSELHEGREIVRQHREEIREVRGDLPYHDANVEIVLRLLERGQA